MKRSNVTIVDNETFQSILNQEVDEEAVKKTREMFKKYIEVVYDNREV